MALAYNHRDIPVLYGCPMLTRFVFPAVIGALAVAASAQRILLDDLADTAVAAELRGSDRLAEFEPIELPGNGLPRGLARIGNAVWLARGDRLLRLSWPAAKVEVDVAAPAGLSCLTADRRFLYGVAGAGIVVIDPFAGRVVNTLELSDRQVTTIGVVGDRFVLATPKRVFWCDARFAEVGDLPLQWQDVRWFAADANLLWAGVDTGVLAVPRSGDAERLQTWDWSPSMRPCAGTWIDGRLLIVGERSEFARRGEVLSGLWDPAKAELSGEKLVIVCHGKAELRGSPVPVPSFAIGPRLGLSIDKLSRELERIAKDPTCRVRRADGSLGPMTVMIEVAATAQVAEVKAAWDAATAAGFDRVRMPQLESHVLELRRKTAGNNESRPTTGK